MDIYDDMARRVLVLDGAVGTELMAAGSGEAFFRGDLLRNFSNSLDGNCDILSITRPQTVRTLHLQYLRAGADIITTNTFCSNAIDQNRYGTDGLATGMCAAAVREAKTAIEEYRKESASDMPKYVAGSIGPSTSGCFKAEGCRSADEIIDRYEELKNAFRSQMIMLVDSGADLLLIETATCKIGLESALNAAREAFDFNGRKLPVMVSATVNREGCLPDGTTREEYVAIAERHADIVVSVGLNCFYEPEKTESLLEPLCRSRLAVSCHPNADSPHGGVSPRSPEKFAARMEPLLKAGKLNIVGGCCGTTPRQIRCLAALTDKKPRAIF